MVSSQQLNTKNKAPVLLFNSIFRHWNGFQSSVDLQTSLFFQEGWSDVSSVKTAIINDGYTFVNERDSSDLQIPKFAPIRNLRNIFPSTILFAFSPTQD